MQEDNLLEIIINDRTYSALDRALESDVEYQKIKEEQKQVNDELDDIGLSKQQRRLIDRAISATNACGAAYGNVAYRQGFYDGVKLWNELKKII